MQMVQVENELMLLWVLVVTFSKKQHTVFYEYFSKGNFMFEESFLIFN